VTAKDIQRRLIADLHRRSFVLPNYTPHGWWECDVFELTKAGYFREYEVKCSRGDFFNDAKKVKRPGRWSGKPTPPTKHEWLNASAVQGPTQFWFVVPGELVQDVGVRGIVMAAEVPYWAGLIVATPNRSRQPWSVRLHHVKKAPRLHNQAPDARVAAHARGVTYWRFLNFFLHSKYDYSKDSL
jgi:hypothetical protein